MFKTIIISVDELWLKGKNRHLYFKAIVRHLESVFKAYHKFSFKMKNDSQRLTFSSDEFFSDELIWALKKIPGVSTISPAVVLNRTLTFEEDFKVFSALLIKSCDFFNNASFERPSTFRVSVRRIDKKIATSSVQLEKEFGGVLLGHFDKKIKVELKNPQTTVDIRVTNSQFSLCTQSFKGMGGLPWGTSGHGLVLLSGGFDSPVASYLMNKRGLKTSYVFFHAYPFVGHEVVDKIKLIAGALTQFQRQSHFYVVPFGDIQTAISKLCQEEYRTLFFRKLMVDVASHLSDKIGADVLITGDSLGQVSSQTLMNITVIDKSSTKLILRPLIGFNKMEVIRLAENIETHDLSVIPHDDACALFAPKSPIINPNLNYVDRFFKEHQFLNEIEKAVSNTQVYSVNLQGELFKKDFFSFDS